MCWCQQSCACISTPSRKVCVLPARALLAVEKGVGQLVPMRLGWLTPGQLDEASGHQRSHDVSGGRGGRPCWTAYTSGAWCYMVSSVRSQWRGRERGQGYDFGLGGGRDGGMRARETGRETAVACRGRVGEILCRGAQKEQVEERSWNGNDSGTKEREETKKRKNKITTT